MSFWSNKDIVHRHSQLQKWETKPEKAFIRFNCELKSIYFGVCCWKESNGKEKIVWRIDKRKEIQDVEMSECEWEIRNGQYIYTHTYTQRGVNGLMCTNGDEINVEIAALKAQCIRCFVLFFLYSFLLFFVSLFLTFYWFYFSSLITFGQSHEISVIFFFWPFIKFRRY